jgi:hypothetical protein
MAATGLILGAGSEVDASGNLIVNLIVGSTNNRLDPLTNWSPNGALQTNKVLVRPGLI